MRVADDDPRWRQSEYGYGCNAAGRMDPPPRSPATEADDCFMVRIQKDPTEYKLGSCAPVRPGGLPSDGRKHRFGPIACRMPPCSPPSRCGLARTERGVRLARRPTLTASARDGVGILRSGRGKACSAVELGKWGVRKKSSGTSIALR